MPSLAGRPPYATDEPDSAYTQPERRRPAPPRQEQQRTSAYDVYDNYLDAEKPNGQNRVSGVGAAFMSGDMDEESDSEDDHAKMGRQPMDPHHVPVSMPVPAPVSPGGKNAALAAAVRPRDDDANPPPQYRLQAQTPQPPPAATIAAPRPGYAAPIGALNNAAGTRQVPPGIQVPHPHQQVPHSSPSPTSPHPLQAPITPIQPAFARPRPPKEGQDVKFSGDVVRGGKEDTMLPRRGEKGDDFWRRFSMVVKDEGGQREKTSAWLRKTQNGTSSYSKWIWIIGVILVVAAAGGIGLGWYMSHKAPDHYKPTVIGGSEGEAASTSTTSVRPVGSNGSTCSQQSSRYSD
ncbi:hypothetical protein DL96DRAFT_1712185 [Flagelloscypha sp. PMI_526]|nr:hypothetical protein DL96DRAFT_1712185 [Flagelloscypha sp. PMI_526]